MNEVLAFGLGLDDADLPLLRFRAPDSSLDRRVRSFRFFAPQDSPLIESFIQHHPPPLRTIPPTVLNPPRQPLKRPVDFNSQHHSHLPLRLLLFRPSRQRSSGVQVSLSSCGRWFRGESARGAGGAEFESVEEREGESGVVAARVL